MNSIYLTGKIYNIIYYENIHLIKFDLVSYTGQKGKYLSPYVRLACELWHNDRKKELLQEGGLYVIIGRLKQYVFKKDEANIYKYKYSIDCEDVIKMEEIKGKNIDIKLEEKNEKLEEKKEVKDVVDW